MSASLMVACNDEHGRPSGHVVELQLDEADESHRSWLCDEPGPTFSVDEHRGLFRLGRWKFRWRQHRTWVGNIFWDQFILDDSEAVRLRAVVENDRTWNWSLMVEELWSDDPDGPDAGQEPDKEEGR